MSFNLPRSSLLLAAFILRDNPELHARNVFRLTSASGASTRLAYLFVGVNQWIIDSIAIYVFHLH